MSTLRQRFAFRAGCLLAAMLGLAVLAGGAQRFAPRVLESGNGARWIWAPGDYRDGEPIAFYAVRELELEAACPARIAITADDTYLLYVNGRRVGTGGYRPEAPLDEYQVGDFLEAGMNRILVEARSSRGAGGLLAELLPGDACGLHRPIPTDSSWRIFRRYDPGLFGGWALPEAGEAPKVWGPPPTGRWRLAAARRRRPIPFQGFLSPLRQPPLWHRSYHSVSWQELDAPQPRIPALGPQQVFDWGEEVTGFISFDLRSGEGEPGLLYVSAEPPESEDRPPDAVIVPVPGRHYWEDAQPRRFRYLLLVGVEPASRIEVDLLDSEAALALGVGSTRRGADATHARAGDGAPQDQHDGVFGIEPPRSYSKVEEQVWKRLEDEAAEHAPR